MARKALIYLGLITLALASAAGVGRAQQRQQLRQIEAALGSQVPGLHCVDRNFAVSAQPEDAAYGLLASHGFRTVVSLRTSSEGFDLDHQRQLVEKAGMQFINIPVSASDPKVSQAEEFLKVARDCSNFPMLITCASGNRAAGFWAIYRIAVQGWDQDRALSEAEAVGLSNPVTRKFVVAYVADQRP
ncbi:MAG: fused DSP-PTPase phosphatase/NAD kinase-like protein [Blastocatellia bacterium]